MKKAQQGFTLIELMIVVAIIAILAAIAIPQYQNYIARAQVSEAMTLMDGLKTPVIEYGSQQGTCPTNGQGGIAATTDIKGKYVTSVATAGTYPNCTITATFLTGAGVNSALSGNTIELQGTLDNSATAGTAGSSTWACVSSIPQKYLPTACGPAPTTGTGTGGDGT